MKASLFILALLATYAACAVYQIPLNTSVYLFNADSENSQFAQEVSVSNHSTLCATISLGSPPQYFNVLLATTTSSFWVAGANYSGTPGINTYNSTASTTYFSAPGYLYDIEIISQMSDVLLVGEGFMAMDTFQIGNFTDYDVVFGDASYGVTSPVSGIDGVLGLGFSTVSLVSGMTSMQQILGDGDFDSVSFSLLYSSTSQSYLFLGGTDSTYGSDFTYFPLIGIGMWNFIGSISYGVVPLTGKLEFIIDTTSPGLIYLPSGIQTNYYEATGFELGQTHGKDVLRWLRPLSIKVGDQELTISSSDYMTCNDDNLCQTVVIGQKQRQNSVILGTGFLELFYTHFDYENNRVGFSRRA